MANMKISLLILASFAALALSVPTLKDGKYVEVDKTFLERQKHILQIFYRINQRDHRFPEYEEIGKTFSIYEHADNYNKPEVVKKFVQFYKYSLLPRHEIFSISQQEHLEQAISLFRLFYHAKDWETLYKTAVWARQNLNEGMFVYSFYIALIHRPDTRYYMLPPVYEVMPHYFFSSDVIHKAEILKQIHTEGSKDKSYHTIESNYSGWYLNLHPEQSMSSYLEDVGVNSFYTYYNFFFPTWLSSEEIGWKNSRRGELVYFFIQQLLARYYSERVCYGFGEIPYIDWDTPIETPYEPSLVYPNGLQFPSRPKFANLHEYFYNYGQKWSSNVYGYSHNFVQDFERRINDAIDSGVIYTSKHELLYLYNQEHQQDIEILGNLLASNADSPNKQYYGSILNFARHLLGYSWQPLDQHKLVPSAIEHDETSLRDPVYYQLLKKIFLKFQRYMSHIAPYTEKELVFPGVKITDVKVDPLITYHDHFYADLSNAVWYHPQEKYDFRVRVRQTRLNHKPFTIKLHINSDKEQKAAIKLFYAPKYDEYDRELNLTENRLNMVMLDHKVGDLKTGENEIVYNSHDFKWFADDRVSHTHLYESLLEAEQGKVFELDGRQNGFYFPRRYMLPIGTHGGTTFRIVAVVYPWDGTKAVHTEPREFIPPGASDVFLDKKSLLYPFDRFIKFEKMWYQIPNIYFHDEDIYHKELQEINSPHH